MKVSLLVLASTAVGAAARWSLIAALVAVAVVATLVALRALTADPLTVRTTRRS